MRRLLRLLPGATYESRLPRVRYALFRWILPRLGYEPLTIRNLSQRAWPQVAGVTAGRSWGDRIDEVEWTPCGTDDGSAVFRKNALESRPVKIKGLLRGHPLASMTLDDLRTEFGDVVVPIRVGDYRADFGDPSMSRMPLRTYVDHLLGRIPFPEPKRVVPGSGPYLGNAQLPALARRLPHLEFFGGDVPFTTFWIGAAESFTPLHCHHFCDTLLFQLAGTRSVALIPPHEAQLVGYMPINLNMGMASYDPFAEDTSQFPARAQIHALYTEMQAGDALLIPGFWFHAVRLSGPSLSASSFCRTRMPLVLGGGALHPWRESAYFRGW